MELLQEQLEKLRAAFHQNPSTCSVPELTKGELGRQLLTVIGIDETISLEQTENIVSNYIYLTELIKCDIANINSTLKKLQYMESTTPASEEYQHKKIRYFAKLNKEAKEDIEFFLVTGVKSFLLESKNRKWEITDNNEKSDSLLLRMRYDYSLFHHYYDIDYDFSTEAKIRFLPGVDIIHMREIVDKFIALKKSDIEEYNTKIGKIVSDNKCIEYIRNHIASNFYMHKRLEIFQTLVELYEKRRFQSYIALAMIELEGIFADCCNIIANEERKNSGTLVEKAEKVFSNIRLKQAIYPYYAFSLPILRNEIAHKGFVSDDRLEGIANVLTLDLYTVVYWTEHYSNDKFLAASCAYEKLNTPDTKGSEASIVFCELFSCYQTYDREFLDVLADPTRYDDELQFFKTLNDDPHAITIQEMVQKISGVIKSESFWKYIAEDILSEDIKHTHGKPYDVIDFVAALRTHVIPLLRKDSPEKIQCQEASERLKAYGC